MHSLYRNTLAVQYLTFLGEYWRGRARGLTHRHGHDSICFDSSNHFSSCVVSAMLLFGLHGNVILHVTRQSIAV